MIAASTYLPSTSSSTIAASSIHGTGAQNFSSAMRNGWSAVSGIALGRTSPADGALRRPSGRSADHPLRPLPIWRARALHRTAEQS